jgi:iron(III) transport system ATP-binding protein
MSIPTRPGEVAPAALPAGIEFVGVTKRYGQGAAAATAVDAVSFRVAAGSLATILGPSGSGKTTILRLIAGLEAPSGGRILIAGHDVADLPPARRDVSMVFQSYALFPHLDVLGNVAYGLDVSGVPRAEARRRALVALETVGLPQLGARLPSELSGGQQQRVALARALVLEPAVLLFDEPLSNLDARLRRSMREEIRALQQRLKLTVAYVTHDQAEAMAVSDQVIVMDHGRIAQSGTPVELYERPASAFVAGFMGEATLFDARARADGTLALGPLVLKPSAGAGASNGDAASNQSTGTVKVAVRPSAWAVLPPGAGMLAATVSRSAYLGSQHEYTFDTAIGPVFVAVPSSGAPLATGATASLALGDHGWSVLGDPPPG